MVGGHPVLEGHNIRKVEDHCVKTMYRVQGRECLHCKRKREPDQEGGAAPACEESPQQDNAGAAEPLSL